MRSASRTYTFRLPYRLTGTCSRRSSARMPSTDTFAILAVSSQTNAEKRVRNLLRDPNAKSPIGVVNVYRSPALSPISSAARGAYDALGLLLGGLCLALAAAALGGAIAERVRAAATSPAAARRTALAAAAAVLVLLPLSGMLDPALFYDRTRSTGTGAAALLFVAGFAGAMSGAAARSLFAPPSQAEFLTALSGRPALLSTARLSALEATRWLVPLVPALAAAAVFACAKADQDPSLHGEASGLGALIRAAMGEVSAADRLSSAALAGGALVVLWYLGHRFVLEMRASLGTRGTAG